MESLKEKDPEFREIIAKQRLETIKKMFPEKDPDKIISDEKRAEEMKGRSYLSEVKTIFRLRDEK